MSLFHPAAWAASQMWSVAPCLRSALTLLLPLLAQADAGEPLPASLAAMDSGKLAMLVREPVMCPAAVRGGLHAVGDASARSQLDERVRASTEASNLLLIPWCR